MINKPKELPKSEDKDFWDESAETYVSTPGVKSPVCESHAKDSWYEHEGYVDNGDGTASCKHCSWGFRIPGYMRIYKEKVYDFRNG